MASTSCDERIDDSEFAFNQLIVLHIFGVKNAAIALESSGDDQAVPNRAGL